MSMFNKHIVDTHNPRYKRTVPAPTQKSCALLTNVFTLNRNDHNLFSPSSHQSKTDIDMRITSFNK